MSTSAKRSRRMPCRVSSSYGAGAGRARSCAARSWWQHGAASTQRAPQRTARASASSVAVSQACSASTRSGAGSDDRVERWCRPRTGSGRPQPSRVGQPGVAVPLVLADVDADEFDVDPPPGEVAVRGEGEVRVAAAEVDHAQRAGELGGKGGGQGPQEGVDLAPLGGAAADRVEERVPGIEQVLPHPVVPVAGPVGGLCRLRRRRGAPAPRHAWSPGPAGSSAAVSTCQLPNGSASSASTAASASGPNATLRVYGRVPSVVTICSRGRP